MDITHTSIPCVGDLSLTPASGLTDAGHVPGAPTEAESRHGPVRLRQKQNARRHLASTLWRALRG